MSMVPVKVLTITVALVVALATAEQRPTNVPPALIIDPLLSACRLENGSVVEGLESGGSVTIGCEICDCYEGMAECFPLPCTPPPCADSQLDGCCRVCPNGKNCRTPTGTIIKDGEMVPVDDMVCLCSVEGYTTDWRMAGPEDAPDAFCVPANRSTCLGPDGIVMQPGDIWTSPDGCQNCQCHFGEKYATCMLPSCTPPNCVNPRRVRGECCESCPNGENCRLPSGMVIRNGKRKKFDREICFCRPNENGPGLEAVCTLRKSATRTKATAKKLRRLEKIRQESSGDMTPAELAKLLRRIDNLQQALKN